jgi:uncharacterized protein with PQ loop repeat
MEDVSMETIIALLAYTSGLFFSICLVPQLQLMWKNRSATDVSLSWTTLFIVGLICQIVYLALMGGYIWLSVVPELSLALGVLWSKYYLDNLETSSNSSGSSGSSNSRVIPHKKDYLPIKTSEPHDGDIETASSHGKKKILPSLNNALDNSNFHRRSHVILSYHNFTSGSVADDDILSNWIIKLIKDCLTSASSPSSTHPQFSLVHQHIALNNQTNRSLSGSNHGNSGEGFFTCQLQLGSGGQITIHHLVCSKSLIIDFVSTDPTASSSSSSSVSDVSLTEIDDIMNKIHKKIITRFPACLSSKSLLPSNSSASMVDSFQQQRQQR